MNVQPFFISAALLLGAPAFAEKADKNKPINVEADSVVHDEAKQVSVLQGNVILTKGTIVMRAQQMEVRKDAAENQFLNATPKAGERVFFRVKREGLDEFMEGEALRIEYDGKLDVATLTGRAVLRRLRGATLADESIGELIVFNNTTETMNIKGASPGSNQRVRMMLSPKEEKLSAAPAVPVPTGGVANPVLRPSTLAK